MSTVDSYNPLSIWIVKPLQAREVMNQPSQGEVLRSERFPLLTKLLHCLDPTLFVPHMDSRCFESPGGVFRSFVTWSHRSHDRTGASLQLEERLFHLQPKQG